MERSEETRRILETSLICVHSVLGIISVIFNVYVTWRISRLPKKVLQGYKWILLIQEIVNLMLAILVVFLQLRVFITPFGTVYVVLGLASFLPHMVSFVASNFMSSLFLVYYLMLVAAMFSKCHELHKRAYTCKITLIMIAVICVGGVADFVLSTFLFYENEEDTRLYSRGRSHETALNRHLVFAIKVHDKIVDIVVNYIDTLVMVFSFALLIFFRYRIRVFVRRNDLALPTYQEKLLNLIMVHSAIVLIMIIVPSIGYFLLYDLLKSANLDFILFLLVALALLILPICTFRALRTLNLNAALLEESGDVTETSSAT